MAHSGTLIFMRNEPSDPDLRVLTAPLRCLMFDGSVDEIPVGFTWNGNSSGIFQFLFPRHNHPIASCCHDHRCGKARNAAERLFADNEFKKDVRTTGWWVTAQAGYIGVRIGAFFGVGSSFKGITA